MVQNICTNGMVNCNGTIGKVLVAATEQITGNIFITLLFVLAIIIAIAIMFGIKLEYTSIIILPLLFGYMAATKEFIGFTFMILIYLALLLTKHFILK